jgi:pyruvate/2-oxoglutarate dehydrogenase complex dihydrolipoamide acyltransferase (E2) component
LVEPFEKRYGLKLSLTHLFFKAAAIALEETPELNATLDGDRIILRGAKNIGMVVTAPGGGGIMIPVIRDVQAKRLDQIAREWAAVIERLEAGSLTFDDLSGGTFTISNVGPAGIDLFTPLIHPPESAILGISRVREEPVVEAGQIVVGRVLSLIVGADHRVFDAEPIGAFLTALDRLVQNPNELLL